MKVTNKEKYISRNKKSVRIKTDYFRKKGEIEDYNIHTKDISNNQRELIIDFVNWKSKNQKEIIFEGYYFKNETDDKSIQDPLSDLYPLNQIVDSRKLIMESFAIWTFIFPNIFVLGFSTLLSFLIFSSFLRTEDYTQPSIFSIWLYICMFVLFPTFFFLAYYKAFKLLSYLLKKSIRRTRNQNFRLENNIQAIGILFMLALTLPSLYIAFNNNISLKTAYYTTFTLTVLSTFFSIILIFSYFKIVKLREKVKMKREIKNVFLRVKEKEDLPKNWISSKISFGNEEEMFYKIPARVVKWKKIFQPFFFKDYENDYEKYLNFKHFTAYKQKTKVKEGLKKAHKYFLQFLGNFAFLIVSMVLFVIHFWDENYVYWFIVLYLLTSFIIEAIIKTEQVFFDDIYINSINEVVKKEYVAKWTIVDEHLFVLTTKDRVLKSIPIIKIENIKSNMLLPEIFLDNEQEISVKITFENSRKFILFGYSQEYIEKMRKKSLS
ncbi:MAG: hypothetical protein K9W45_00760 [Candidatus Heimdallarchaeum aukensis]|uniref:Uncharacterized protein n=1 Tax=Candidatus Heimdallarchaeum aukensis TaxID=2876573 RepID=A0A9Y1FL64_9ARCH|nr:MAG: hypothetical protein K9W45_00760 [Candidatus Heimdallarchaeum aukensis]